MMVMTPSRPLVHAIHARSGAHAHWAESLTPKNTNTPQPFPSSIGTQVEVSPVQQELSKMSQSRMLIVSTLFLVIPACASTSLPQQQLMNTQGAITSAEELQGDDDPDAKLHLTFARDQLNSAKQMMANGDGDEAERMLDRASVDADLALLLARSEKLRQQSSAAKAEVTELQSANNKGGGTAPASTAIGSVE